MMKKHIDWTLSNLFAALLLILGLGLLLVAVITSFGTKISIDAVITAAVLLLAGIIYLHPAPFSILAPTIGIVSLSAGYVSYFSSPHQWWLAILATLVMAALLSYGFSLRKTLRQRHSSWYRWTQLTVISIVATMCTVITDRAHFHAWIYIVYEWSKYSHQHWVFHSG